MLQERGYQCSEAIIYQIWKEEGFDKRPYLIDRSFRPTKPKELYFIDYSYIKATNGSQIAIIFFWDEFADVCVDIPMYTIDFVIGFVLWIVVFALYDVAGN